MGHIGPQKSLQAVPNEPHLPVLITVETHSVVGSGELVHKTDGRSGVVISALLSVVS
jgi:hypothetical protein